jgi:hypothetical protein
MMPWGAKKAGLTGTGQTSSWSEDDLRPDLGYVQEMPISPTPAKIGSGLATFRPDPISEMAGELVKNEWPVAYLRRAIEGLGGQAKGRTRTALAEQYASAFLDEARLARRVEGLSKDERQAYILMLLEGSLRSYYTAPDTQKLWKKVSSSPAQAVPALLRAQLGLMTEDEQQMWLPFGLYQRLPPLSLPLPTIKQPAKVVPAADPHEALGQIQQLLALLQTETFTLRPRLRWRAPVYPYAQPIVCWPPMPADAEKLNTNASGDRVLGLLPPDPYLDAPSLEAWSRSLGVPPEWAEFYYHLLLGGNLIMAGSPILVNEETVHAWMSLTPGEQVIAALAAYRDIGLWAVWWSRWRSGDVRVRRSYHGYWGLNSVDQTVMLAGSRLRWVLLEFLSFLPQDAWMDIKVVHDHLTQLFPTVDSHRYLMGLTVESVKGGWAEFLRATLLETLTGPLWALGFVELSPSVEGVRAIRLVGLQDVVWGRVGEIPLQPTGELNRSAMQLVLARETRATVVPVDQPHPPAEGAILEIKSPIPPAFTTFVLRWARPAGFSKNLFRYELDVERLHRTFEDGDDPDGLAESWQSTTGFAPLSQIAEWWRFWWDRYGRVRFYPAQALLETRDAFTLQEVQAALPQLQASILGIVTPHAALLDSDDVDKILSALLRQGYMPKEST